MDLLESMLQSEEDEDAGDVSKTDTCSGRRCSANEHCCAGSVCVDVDGRKQIIMFVTLGS